MGLYATLKGAAVLCPSCGVDTVTGWQFYYGSVWDLPEYHIGDEIRWGGQSFGNRMDGVFAVAYPTDDPACFACRLDCFLALIQITSNRIIGISFYKEADGVPEELLDSDGKVIL